MFKKQRKASLSAFSILMIVLVVICAISILLNGSPISSDIINKLGADRYGDLIDRVAQGETIKVTSATLKDFVMAIPNGYQNAADLIVFLCALGGFIGVVMKTGALESGVYHLVKKLKGREELLIGVLMFLFSLGGTTYGMAEETIGFYALITTAMIAAGFDSVVAVGTILLGAGAGVLGSTINPFSTGAAMNALEAVDIHADNNIIMVLGIVLWLSSLALCMFFVISYARKVKADKGSTILSLQEQEVMKEHFSKEPEEVAKLKFTKKHRLVLTIFALSFAVMIASLIDYQTLVFHGDEDAYLAALGWTGKLTGQPLGWWYFMELAAWFIIAGILVAIVAGMSENEYIKNMVSGTTDLLSVGMIIAVARGITIVMGATHIDLFILEKSSIMLQGVPSFIFASGSYIVYLFLSFLVPSTSGLAALSIPVMGGVANALSFNPTVMIMIFSAGCGLINLFTPTSGVVMGGLGAARVEYSTYVKWGFKLFVVVAIANMIILSIAMMMLS